MLLVIAWFNGSAQMLITQLFGSAYGLRASWLILGDQSHHPSAQMCIRLVCFSEGPVLKDEIELPLP